jgi:hypothetical protein
MTYLILHFLHLVGALGMAAAYAVEAAGLVGMRRSTTGDDARAWFQTRRWVLVLGPSSIGLVLATGIYTIVVAWGWAGWIDVSLASLVAVAVIGGLLTGIPMARIGPSIERTVGALPEDLQRDSGSRVLAISMTTRVAITIGIVFLMVRKPDMVPSVMVIGLAAAIGVGAGLALGVRKGKAVAGLELSR